MLNTFDFYDLYAVLIKIRIMPSYSLNYDIVSKILEVLNNRDYNNDINQVREALKSIVGLDENVYSFAFKNNVYPYIPKYIKDEEIYELLIACFNILLTAIENKDYSKVESFADDIHNFPLLIIENRDYNIHRFRKQYMKNHKKRIKNR